MDWPAWRPLYEEILRDFGFDGAADEAARDLLDALLETRLAADLDALARQVAGRTAFVAGAALREEDLRLVPAHAPLLVADAAATRVVPRRRPLAIVTDLDGDVPAQAVANAMGVPLFVHAHGDNLDALRAHVPLLKGPLVGTTQAEPRGRVRNFGGFTDGDRAACVAAALGASSVGLVGFDFEAPVAKPGRDAATKRRKLAWARRVMDALDVPVYDVSASTHA